MKESALKKLRGKLKDAGLLGPQTKSKLKKQQKVSIQPSINPFELKVTRNKHDVLNRKVKGKVGKPTLSKKRDIELVKFY